MQLIDRPRFRLDRLFGARYPTASLSDDMFHVKLTDLTFYADSTMDPPKVKLAFIAWAPLCRRMDMRTTIR